MQVGDRIGELVIVRKLAEGGMGEVFEARHEKIKCRVAVKALHPELAHDPTVVARLRQEALLVNLVQHRDIVNIFDFGETQSTAGRPGFAYIVMEYLDGESLSERLRARSLRSIESPGSGPASDGRSGASDGRSGASGGPRAPRLGRPLPVDKAMRLGLQVATIMAAAHEKGIVHRDMKPANVMIVADPFASGGERVKLLDFGIATVAMQYRRASEAAPDDGDMVLGTPDYMAPEQWQGQSEVDDRADVYSFGVMLFEMISGRTPFLGDKAVVLARQHLLEPPPRLSTVASAVAGADLAPLSVLIDSMLAKTPATRPSMAAVRDTLARLLSLSEQRQPFHSMKRWLSHPRSQQALAAIGMLVIGAGGALTVEHLRAMRAEGEARASRKEADRETMRAQKAQADQVRTLTEARTVMDQAFGAEEAALARAGAADRHSAAAERDRRTAQSAKEAADRDRLAAIAARELAQGGERVAVAARDQAERDQKAALASRDQAESDRRTALGDKEHAERERLAAIGAKEQAEADRQSAIAARAQAEREREAAIVARKQAEENERSAIAGRTQAEGARQAAVAAADAAEERRRAALVAEEAAERGRADAEKRLERSERERDQAAAARDRCEKAPPAAPTPSSTATLTP